MSGLKSTVAAWKLTTIHSNILGFGSPEIFKPLLSQQQHRNTTVVIQDPSATGPSAKVKSLCYPLLSRPWTLVFGCHKGDPCQKLKVRMHDLQLAMNRNPTIHDMIHDTSLQPCWILFCGQWSPLLTSDDQKNTNQAMAGACQGYVSSLLQGQRSATFVWGSIHVSKKMLTSDTSVVRCRRKSFKKKGAKLFVFPFFLLSWWSKTEPTMDLTAKGFNGHDLHLKTPPDVAGFVQKPRWNPGITTWQTSDPTELNFFVVSSGMSNISSCLKTIVVIIKIIII